MGMAKTDPYEVAALSAVMQGSEQGRRFVVLLGSLLVSGSASEGEFAESWSDISMAGEITVNNSAVFQRHPLQGFAGLDHDMDEPIGPSVMRGRLVSDSPMVEGWCRPKSWRRRLG